MAYSYKQSIIAGLVEKKSKKKHGMSRDEAWIKATKLMREDKPYGNLVDTTSKIGKFETDQWKKLNKMNVKELELLRYKKKKR